MELTQEQKDLLSEDEQKRYNELVGDEEDLSEEERKELNELKTKAGVEVKETDTASDGEETA